MITSSRRSLHEPIGTEDQLHEGRVTQLIERQTAKVPSATFINLALVSMALSAGVAVFGRRKEIANFVGLWAPSFLLIGIYNKLVKLEGRIVENR